MIPTTPQTVGLIKNELQRWCKKVHKQDFRFYSGNSFKDVKTVICMPRSKPSNSGIHVTHSIYRQNILPSKVKQVQNYKHYLIRYPGLAGKKVTV
jgi:hypothetical protein